MCVGGGVVVGDDFCVVVGVLGVVKWGVGYVLREVV